MRAAAFLAIVFLSGLARAEPDADGAPDPDRAYDALVAALQVDRAALAAAIDEARAGRLEVDGLDARASAVITANRERASLLPQLSRAKGAEVQGLSRAGIHQVWREIDHARLVARWYATSRTLHVVRFFAVQDPVLLGLVGAGVLQVLVVAGIGAFIFRRAPRWLAAVRGLVARGGRGAWRIVVMRWLSGLGQIAPAVVRLATVYALFEGVLDLVDAAELHVLGAVLIAWGWYRLCVAAAEALVAALPASRVGLPRAVSEHLARSIRLVARCALGLHLALMFTEVVLDRGVLHGLVELCAFVVATGAAAVLLGSWRQDIASAYVARFADGVLARAVERTRHRRIGFFVAAAAFAFVFVAALAAWVRASVLDIGHARRALAYLFRRRLEKKLLETPDVVDERVLPDELRAAFGAATAGMPLVELFPRLEAVVARIAGRQPGAAGFSLAVVGDSGMGRTTWLETLRRRLLVPAPIRSFQTRVLDERGAAEAIADLFGIDPAARGDVLVAAVLAAPPRTILLDDCHAFVLRAASGMGAARVLFDVVARTRTRHVWICTFAARAFAYVQTVDGGANLFDEVVRLTEWTEDDVGALVDGRMRAAGAVARYDDLVVDRLEGSALETEVIRSAAGFRRLLWDYSDGNPRIALHFWTRSLAPLDGDAYRVRLFAAPTADELNALEHDSRFVLACLVQHAWTTPDECARALRLPRARCEGVLLHLIARGVVRASGDRHVVTTTWDRAVHRFLRRNNLLFS